MNRTQKAQEIESLKERFAKSQLTILTEYKGLTVSEMTELRGKLRETSSTLKVVKNRLAKIAIKGTDHEPLTDSFKDTVAVATAGEDPTGPAKVLVDFAKANEKLSIKAALLDGKVISENEVKALASMPSKEELIAKLMGSMQAPAQNLVGVLSQIPRQVVQVLSAVKAHKEENA